MKVKELIEELQKLDPEKEVQVSDITVETWLCEKIEIIDYWDNVDGYILAGKI